MSTNLPFGNQTWLAGESPMNGGFHRRITYFNGPWFPACAMYDDTGGYIPSNPIKPPYSYGISHGISNGFPKFSLWFWSKDGAAIHHAWLVGWNIFIFPYFGNNHPNWLVFFRGVETTNTNQHIVWGYGLLQSPGSIPSKSSDLSPHRSDRGACDPEPLWERFNNHGKSPFFNGKTMENHNF